MTRIRFRNFTARSHRQYRNSFPIFCLTSTKIVNPYEYMKNLMSIKNIYIGICANRRWWKDRKNANSNKYIICVNGRRYNESDGIRLWKNSIRSTLAHPGSSIFCVRGSQMWPSRHFYSYTCSPFLFYILFAPKSSTHKMWQGIYGSFHRRKIEENNEYCIISHSLFCVVFPSTQCNLYILILNSLSSGFFSSYSCCFISAYKFHIL